MTDKKVVHLGGVFIYANNPKVLADWYKDYLGMTHEAWGKEGPFGIVYHYKDNDDTGNKHYQVWSVMKSKEELKHAERNFSLNLRVNDIKALVAALKERGTDVKDVIVDDFGLFSSVTDLEGNHIELWEDTSSNK